MIFSCYVGHFWIPCCLHSPFSKSCCLDPLVEFLGLRDSLNQYFWELCASSFPQLWFHVARLEEQYSFKATCVFFSHSLSTPSTVLRMGFGNWAALKIKMGEKLTLIYNTITSLILHLYCTPANKEDQEYNKIVEQQTGVPKLWLLWAWLPSSKLFNPCRMLLWNVLVEVLVRDAGTCVLFAPGKKIYKCI